jgi:hypothetical protein
MRNDEYILWLEMSVRCHLDTLDALEKGCLHMPSKNLAKSQRSLHLGSDGYKEMKRRGAAHD